MPCTRMVIPKMPDGPELANSGKFMANIRIEIYQTIKTIPAINSDFQETTNPKKNKANKKINEIPRNEV